MTAQDRVKALPIATSVRSFRLVARARDLVDLILTAQDTTTEIGRSRERQRRIALTGLASAAAKVITVSTGLISVPLTLNYLGPERYGMWMTMSTLIAMLSFADLGIGNGLLSAIGSAYGHNDRGRIRALVSSAYAVLTVIALTVVAVFAIVYPSIPWAAVFNVKTPQAVAEAGPSFAALISCFALAVPLGVVQRTQMALQRGFMANLWQCFDSVVGLAAVLTAIHFKAPLPYLVLGFAGAPQLANILNSVLFFGWLQPDLAPRPTAASLSLVRSIAATGMLFLVLQIVGSITYASDGVIVAQTLGASAVALYAVPQKLFGVIGTVLAMVLAPLWPAYSEAIARGDRVWVHRTLRLSLLLSVGTALLISLPLIVFGRVIIAGWAGTAVMPSLDLLITFGVWKVVEAGGLPLSIYFNGLNKLTFQVVTGILTALSGFAFKIVLIMKIGLDGIMLATTLAFLIFSVVPAVLFRKRLRLTI